MNGQRRSVSIICLLFVLASAGGARSQESAPARSSLLFSTGEVAEIQRALSEVGKTVTPVQAEADAAAPIPNVYVSAVAQYGRGRWTVWANGYRIAPGRQAPEFTVLAVLDDDRVVISVPGDRPARFTLQPHQTWLAASDSVVEGIVP